MHTEYNHLLATQLDSQRQYFESLIEASEAAANQRVLEAEAAASSLRQAADAAMAQAKEADRKRQGTEKKLVRQLRHILLPQ